MPNLLPQLRAGMHLDPADGACFMEYASVRAGAQWSDRPRCTHPVLAALARLVNDATSDHGRAQLTELAPAVIGVGSDDVETAPAVAYAALRVAPQHGGGGRSVSRHKRRARRRLVRLASHPGSPAAIVPLADRLYRRGPAMHALIAAVRALRFLPPVARDEALRAVLVAGIDACRPLPRDGRSMRVVAERASG